MKIWFNTKITFYVIFFLRNAEVFTMVQVAAELAEPMVNGLINEMDDAFHCSDVLQGFRVFELADIPSNLPDLMEYGEV